MEELKKDATPVGSENDNSVDSSTNSNDNGDTRSSTGGDSAVEEKLPPFHEHPRFKEVIAENQRLKAQAEDFTKFKAEAEPVLSQFKPKVEIPKWFGGDEAQWKDFNDYQNNIKENAKKEAIADWESKQQGMQTRIKEANDHFEQSVKSIESKGYKVNRDQLLKTAQDFELVDSKGRWNYLAAAEILKSQFQPKVDTEGINAKKRTFSSGKDNTADQTKKDFMSGEDFRKPGNRPW